MRIVPELLVCLLLLIFNSMQKNKSIILSGVLKILCQFLGITKMKPDELSLVVCPSSWIPAFLQPTKRILKRKIFKFCLFFFHFTHDLKPVGFESAVFFTWSCFLTGDCSDLVACLLEVLYLIKAAGYWYKPETETPFSPFTWLESPAWQCRCPQRDGTWSKWHIWLGNGDGCASSGSQPSCWCAGTVVVVLSSILFPLYWLVWCFFGVLLGDDCIQKRWLLLKIKVLVLSFVTSLRKRSEVNFLTYTFQFL